MKTTQPIELDRAPWLAGVSPLEAVRLHPRRATQPLDAHSSKMGWPFLWPANEPWPICMRQDLEKAAWYEGGQERAERLGIEFDRESTLDLIYRSREGHNASYLPVLQLTRSQFPQLPFPGSNDLFQLLWCPTVHFEGEGGYLTVWRDSNDVTDLRIAPPPPALYGYSIFPCTLDPELLPDYPHLRDIADGQEGFEIDDNWWDLLDAIGPACGTKLFGFPRWEHYPEYPSCKRCGKRMNVLITISSDEFGHGGRDDTRWIPYEDRDFLEGESFTIWQKYELPHDWMIGDGGDAYLFYCRTCPGEFNSRVQCG